MIIKSTYPINEDAFKDIKTLLKDYDILSSIETTYGRAENKIILKDSISKKCRFCGKQYPEVKFSNIAHALPEFIGNRNVISDFECDSCNDLFAKFESEFGSFMLPQHALAGLKTKKRKYAKYKAGIIIQMKDGNVIQIDDFPHEISPDMSEIQLDLKIPTHIPDYVYRSLIKIGLTIIPESSTETFRHVFKWLINVDADTKFSSGMFFSIFPFSNPSDKVRCVVLQKKREIEKSIPEVVMILSYSNFSFQTYFPLADKADQNTINPFPVAIPGPLDLNLNLVPTKATRLIDLSQKTQVKDKVESFIIRPGNGK